MIRLTDDARRGILARAKNISEGVRTAVNRYYKILQYEREQLKQHLTRDELAEICMDAKIDMLSISVSNPAIAAKIKTMTPSERAALIDAVERYRRACDTDIPIDPKAVLDTRKEDTKYEML